MKHCNIVFYKKSIDNSKSESSIFLSSTKSNFLFVEGHVESLSYFQTMQKLDGGMGSASDQINTMWDSQKN